MYKQFDRTLILYSLDRLDEALSQINASIDATPCCFGPRYYLRALIYYRLGRTDLALADIETGSGLAWQRGGVRSYVLGLIALDSGQREQGMNLLLEAEASLHPQYSSTILKQTQPEFAKLGATPLVINPERSTEIDAHGTCSLLNSVYWRLPVTFSSYTVSHEPCTDPDPVAEIQAAPGLHRLVVGFLFARDGYLPAHPGSIRALGLLPRREFPSNPDVAGLGKAACQIGGLRAACLYVPIVAGSSAGISQRHRKIGRAHV